MPYTHEVNHIKLVGLQDRRRELSDEQKAEIIRLRDEGWSLMKLAKEFEVSKKLILLIVNPESKAKNDKYIKDNWREFQQTKEEHNEAVKKTRHHRQELFLKGELKWITNHLWKSCSKKAAHPNTLIIITTISMFMSHR